MASLKTKKKLGELLVQSGLIKADICKTVLSEQRGTKKKLGELLIEKGHCTEHDIAAALSSQLGIQFVDLKIVPVEPAALEIIPENLSRKHFLIPISIEGRDLSMAFADPFSYEAIEDARFVSGYEIKPFISTKTDILWAIDKHYNLNSSVDSIVSDIRPEADIEVVEENLEAQFDINDIKKQIEAAPIIRMVNLIITKSVEQGASDIHIEPAKESLVVRHRVDGALRLTMTLPKWVQGAVISRIKIMSKMDITEKRIPQDGRIQIKVGKKMLDLRVSSLPANYGEKIVIRILDPASVVVSMEDLGIGGKALSSFKSLIEKPQGIILVTGPTGSGKTTTLYAALSQIKSVEKNVTTIEDPVEYELDGINQVGVNEKAGCTFPGILRSLLRQDPDVIMVGEMRDNETTTIAMQASLTGHLVLSTIHTNNTVATITRLRNLGIPSYLIASTIIGIIAQRLVRVICPFCKVPDDPGEELIKKLRLQPPNGQKIALYRGKGCAQCSGTGYKGRSGVYEMLVLSPKFKEAVANEASEAELTKTAIADGLETLQLSSKSLVLKGLTSVDEALRVVQTDEIFTT